MADKFDIGRRDFFKQAAGVVGAVAQSSHWPGFTDGTGLTDQQTVSQDGQQDQAGERDSRIQFPRVFKSEELKMIAFPLGGVAAGSIALGGRGQLRDWEIFNRPNKGWSPNYAFPAIWVKSGESQPTARVLEASLLPPYEGQDGLGSNNVPGLSRLAGAEFTGQFPLAKVRFEDSHLPVKVELEAFSPFIPHDPDESGLPVAILRYHVNNTGSDSVTVGIAFSIDNPVEGDPEKRSESESRINEHRKDGQLEGLVMTNRALAANDPRFGSFALAVLSATNARTTHWSGWPKGRWWNSPMLFWDAFSRDGALPNEPSTPGTVGAVCQQVTIAPHATAAVTFLLAWHFPNRTPNWCGWDSPPGEGDTIIGNFYCTRFKNAWEVAAYTAGSLPQLESRTRTFADAFAQSTLPGAVKDAASANLSTLVTTTCFRTADGAFHGFEGSDDKRGCCFGNCTHVWNYETATAFLFPSFARSLREAAFGYSMDDQGGMRFRQLLPDGKERYKIAAADGQMGQILHAYLDWKLCGDKSWLIEMWPRVKKAMGFAWIRGGWDTDRKGILDGVQHTTYDVEFYGPNPLGSIYYLGALRAAEEMARSVGDDASAADYRRLFTQGSRWVDENLFQGEFYIQKVRGFHRDQIAPELISGFGSENTEEPEYQAAGGCLIDQMLGQYLANISGLGPLVSHEHVRTSLESIYRYNYKRTLVDHDSVQRTYALNNEAAVVVCDYGKAARPEIPFPYYAEAWTGPEHSTAALMVYAGMVPEAVEYVENVRSRYDGIKRNPWDEAECGHHYARAMSSWTNVVALSGFEYDASTAAMIVAPRISDVEFRCFWSTGTGWGVFQCSSTAKHHRLVIKVLSGGLPCKSIEMVGTGATTSVASDGQSIRHKSGLRDGRTAFTLLEPIVIKEGSELQVELIS